MKATYQDFLDANPNCSGFNFNKDAIAIFDILNEDNNIIKMIEVTESGKPALVACANSVEAYVDSKNDATINLNDGFTRTVIGRMVKAILEPFGYQPTIQKTFPKSCQVKYFTSASCYKLTGAASMRVVKRIEQIK